MGDPRVRSALPDPRANLVQLGLEGASGHGGPRDYQPTMVRP
jgi:hypothetical protein